MLKKMGKKQFVCVELNDYVFRLLVRESTAEKGFSVFELGLEDGLVENGKILNEMALFDLLKATLNDWDMVKNAVRFFVFDHSVLMRPIDLPEDTKISNLKSYVQMEIGNSIHLPFDNPLFDVHDADPLDSKAVLFAVPDADVRCLSELYDDASLVPEVADIRMLANGRFLSQSNLFVSNRSYLIADWSINGLSIGIFTDSELEFLRFQEIDSTTSQWNGEGGRRKRVTFSVSGDPTVYHNELSNQVMEIGRIINFYRFSLHKGERNIDKIILMGDNPEMDFIKQQIEDVQELEITVIDDAFIQQFYPNLNGRHASLVGLALRGGE